MLEKKYLPAADHQYPKAEDKLLPELPANNLEPILRTTQTPKY